MINKVTYKDCPELFNDILESSIDNEQTHRRGSNFFRVDIIELKEGDKQYYPQIENFEDYIGLWRTDEWIFDPEHGSDESPSVLTRVEKRVRIVEIEEYVEV